MLDYRKPSSFSCVSEAHLSSAFQRPHKASAEEMTKYHSDEYIKFLHAIRPDNMSEYSKQMQRCEFGQRGQLCRFVNFDMSAILWLSLRCGFAVNVGEDCPVFDGLFEFCQLSAGGSVGELFSLKLLLRRTSCFGQ